MTKLTQEQIVTQVLNLVQDNSTTNLEALSNLAALTNLYIVTNVLEDTNVPTPAKSSVAFMAAQLYSAMLVDGLERAVQHVEKVTGFKVATE